MGYNERTNSLWLLPREYFLVLTLSVNDASKDSIFWCTFITFVNIVYYGVGDVVFVHSMKVYRGSRVISALDWSKWSNSWQAPAVLAHGKIPSNHPIGDWVDPQKWWEVLEKRTSLVPAGIQAQTVQPVANNYAFPTTQLGTLLSTVVSIPPPLPFHCTTRSFSIVKGTQYPEEIVLKLAGYSNDRTIPRFIKLKKWTSRGSKNDKVTSRFGETMRCRVHYTSLSHLYSPGFNVHSII